LAVKQFDKCLMYSKYSFNLNFNSSVFKRPHLPFTLYQIIKKKSTVY
jgi:hypothetical protein